MRESVRYVVLAYSLGTQEEEAGRSVQVHGQPGRNSEFKASQGDIMKPHLKKYQIKFLRLESQLEFKYRLDSFLCISKSFRVSKPSRVLLPLRAMQGRNEAVRFTVSIHQSCRSDHSYP